MEDSGIASPNNGAYRSLLNASENVGSELAAGTYIVGDGSASTPVASGATANSQGRIVPLLGFAKADYEVAGKTQKLRLRAQILTNATKPTIKFTFGLYPVTVAGGANVVTVTLGTVVSGSALEFNEPTASTVTFKETSDFTIPSDGAYVLGVVTSAKLTASAAAILGAQLQTRSV